MPHFSKRVEFLLCWSFCQEVGRAGPVPLSIPAVTASVIHIHFPLWVCLDFINRWKNTEELSEPSAEAKGFPGGSAVNNPLAMQEMRGRSLGQEDPLEEGLAPPSSILAWRIP